MTNNKNSINIIRSMSKTQKIVLGFFIIFITIFSFLFFINKKPSNITGQDIIEIGAILPLTGNSADIGESSRKGIELCIINWNLRGGLKGRKIKSIVYDSKANPIEGKTLSTKMLAEHNPILIYTLISGVALNAKRITEHNKILHLACVGSTNLLEKTDSQTLRNYISPKILGSEIIKAMKEKLHKNKLVVFYVNNELGRSYKNSVENASINEDVTLKVFPYEDNSNDYRSIILKADIKENDVLYVIGVGANIGRVIKQIRESGFNGTILGDANLLNQSSINNAGQAMLNVFVLDFHREKQEEYYRITRQYKDRFGTEMDVFSLLAYEGINTIFQYIEEYDIRNYKNLARKMENYERKTVLGNVKILDNELKYPLDLRPVNK